MIIFRFTRILFPFFIIFLIIKGVAYPIPPFSLLQIKCDGRLIKSLSPEPCQIGEKKWRGDVQRGILFKKDFYALGEANELIITNFVSMKTKYSEELKKGLNNEYYAWRLLYVDKQKIIFDAYHYDATQSLAKQRTYYPFQFDRLTKTVRKLSIANYNDGTPSVYKNKIFYTGKDGVIYWFDNNSIHSLKIKGKSPTISPDGSKIAYTLNERRIARQTPLTPLY